MSPENFCYWLRGYLELNTEDNPGLTPEQLRKVSEHLSLVLREVPKGESSTVFPAVDPDGPPVFLDALKTTCLLCESAGKDPHPIDPGIRCCLTC